MKGTMPVDHLELRRTIRFTALGDSGAVLCGIRGARRVQSISAHD